MTTKVGSVNKNKQIVMSRSKTKANSPGQRSYTMKCGPCGAKYVSNGANVHERKCPRCQDGQPGVKL